MKLIYVNELGPNFRGDNIYNATSIILDSVEKGDIKLVDFNNDGLVDITLAGTSNLDRVSDERTSSSFFQLIPS